MKIIFDDVNTKYEIYLERSNDRGIPFLLANVIVDNGQEIFKGKLKRKVKK